MKLITFAVPCYNSAAYMRHCADTLLTGGDQVEIILVDDGSVDETGAIADEYAQRYPNIVRALHQPNGGHGEGVNQGLRNAHVKLNKNARVVVTNPNGSENRSLLVANT